MSRYSVGVAGYRDVERQDAARQMDALVVGSNYLLNLQARLSKAPRRQAPPMPPPALAPRVHDRFAGGVQTRLRKSAQTPLPGQRMDSENHPIAHRRVDFVTGTDSRMLGRDPDPVYLA